MKKGKDEVEFLKRIGLNIRKARKAQKITQKQLAFECDEIDYRQIQRLEKGSHDSGILLLAKVIEVLGVDIGQIIVIEKKDKKA